MLSPSQRTLLPVRVMGDLSATSVPWPLILNGSGPTSGVYLDFGKEVGGITTISIGDVVAPASTATPGISLGLAWSESTYYVQTGDNSNGGSTDGYLSTGPPGSAGSITGPNTNWTVPTNKLRGGFRYLHLFIEPVQSPSGTCAVGSEKDVLALKCPGAANNTIASVS
jgi:hypothetical protein